MMVNKVLERQEIFFAVAYEEQSTCRGVRREAALFKELSVDR